MILTKNGIRIVFDSDPDNDQLLIQSWLETHQQKHFSPVPRRKRNGRPKKKKQKQFSSVLKSALNEAAAADKMRAPILNRIKMYDKRIEERMRKRREEKV